MDHFDPPLGPAPRKARFRRAIRNVRHAYRTLGALLIVVFGGWAVLDGARLYELTYDTLTTTGVVTKKESLVRGVSRGGVAARDHRLSYTFTTADGTQVADAVASVPADKYELAHVGAPCLVVYLPANPMREHWLNDNDSARTYPRNMMISRGLIALVALLVLIWIERPLRRELALARRGVVAAGQILTTGKSRRRRARAWITYAFQTADGRAMQGRCTVPRSTPAEVRAPGRAIEVLYDAEKPRRNKARLGLDFVEFVKEAPQAPG